MTTSKEATARRSPRAVPVLSKTPVGRRAFVLRLVHDRTVRAARAASAVKSSS
jgi:hypothetical protein